MYSFPVVVFLCLLSMVVGFILNFVFMRSLRFVYIDEEVWDTIKGRLITGYAILTFHSGYLDRITKTIREKADKHKDDEIREVAQKLSEASKLIKEEKARYDSDIKKHSIRSN